MEILIRSAKILDPSSPFHQQTTNLFIKNGIIEAINEVPASAALEMDADGAILSPGWFDLRVSFGDPGLEHKEDIDSGCKVAAAGGFTEVAVLPNTQPVLHSKNEISYLQSRNVFNLTQVHPLGAVTKDNAGKELTEMIDLRKAGAVAFTDGTEPIWHTDIFVKALLYLQKFNGLLINRPEDKHLTNFAGMNEGIFSTQLGMRGMPSIAEELMIARDLRLLRYTGGRLHFAGLSTAKSVEMVREAKEEGLQVSCDVAVHQLVFDHSLLQDFDANFKVNPPFRSDDDIKALLQGLADDTIDVIVSDHQPHEEECKKLEFDQAAFGIIGLQTLLPLINRVASEIPIEKFLEKVTRTPRELLDLPIPEIKEGNEANLTLFDPDRVWTFDQSTNLSKSSNSPLLGTELKGKVMAVFNRGKHWMDQSEPVAN